ncbi:MAG: hypothetical protein QOE60_1107, partial [Thermoleophilaceae bacterium]|nr:hypothetical protein [Thermoleophilaceae bacterium]
MPRLIVPLAIGALLAATATVALASSQVTTFSFKETARAEGAATGIAF